MANLNSEVIQTMHPKYFYFIFNIILVINSVTLKRQVSNECKAAVFSTKNDITSRISDLEKHLGQVTETTSNLARDAKE